ncbi:MAG: group II intron reverse transcriptase/maturase [bacterium]
MHRNSENVSLKQGRIATLAKQSPEMGFTSLIHHLDIEWLYEAYWLTRKDGAPGIDGETWSHYGENLERNLENLLARLKSNSYRAPAVLRKHIPKAGNLGETRPLGIPSFEDKVLQRAIVLLLEPIYELDFLDCSYGFRKGRSAHQAVEALWKQSTSIAGGWILELDIRKFFDEIDHANLMTFLKYRIRDSAVLRLIGKWLNAGVMENGNISYPESGSPQGGVISCLLSNVYLHYVLDEWFDKEVRPRMRGRTQMVRYADDAVFTFSDETDAYRVLRTLPKRFAKFGLRLHPEKTKLVDFRRPRDENKPKGGSGGEAKSFDFLSFTHYWAKSRKGMWVIKRKTSKSRLARAISTINIWCKDNLHRPIPEQQQALNRKLQGHCSYYGITGNSNSLGAFRYWMVRTWRYWLSRRNRKRVMTWSRFTTLMKRYPIKPARAIHSVCLA